MGYIVKTVEVTTTGAAGSATGTANVSFTGELVAIEGDHLGTPVTTTIDIDEMTSAGAAGRKILDLAASATDFVYYPQAAVQDYTGAGLTLDGTRLSTTRIANAGRTWRVTVALSDALAPAVRLRLLVKV